MILPATRRFSRRLPGRSVGVSIPTLVIGRDYTTPFGRPVRLVQHVSDGGRDGPHLLFDYLDAPEQLCLHVRDAWMLVPA